MQIKILSPSNKLPCNHSKVKYGMYQTKKCHIICRKQEEITDSAPSLYGIEAHRLTCQNSFHTTHNFTIQKISDLIYLMCPSTHYNDPPPRAVQQMFTFHIFFNLANIPVPTLPWPYYTIISVRTLNPYNTHQRILLLLKNLKKKQYPMVVIPST